ncbi:unnamed protein product [Clonostachys chloroleuca]|uniref:Uncharacterized protein n=1 Tax=Clonostachys chloroleuca TaxID=1926264 RepID=A0AA35LT96_9HYPO|nr:unnamed protein product [Clonostachys chloroleuca]
MDRLFSDVHESAQAAKQACNDYAKTAGFALIIRNTARHSDGRRGYTSRKNPDTHPSKRRSTISQMTACPFRLWVKPTGDNAYFVQPGQSVQYNHDLEKPVAFSAFRRETIELYKDKIIAMHSSGTPPLKISLFIEAEVIKLKKASKILTPLLPKDISNVIAQHHQDQLEEATYRWALLTLLDIMDQLDIPPPRVTVTDREIALINALESDPRLARSVNLLCR